MLRGYEASELRGLGTSEPGASRAPTQIQTQVPTCALPAERPGQTVGMAAKRYGPRLAASFAALALLGTAAGCSHSPSTQKTTTTTRPRPGTLTNPVAPSIYSVGLDRFVESVEVGGKVLEVSPPPKHAAAFVTAAQAQVMFDAV